MRNAGGLFLVALLAAPGIGHAKRAVAPETWLCGAGEFVSGDGEMVVDIGHDSIGLGDACPMTPATVKSSKKRATFSGRWAGCTGFTGPVRVAAKLATGKCNVLDVKVRAPKQKIRRHFQASRSKGDPKDCQSSDTFDQIQRRIFGARGCRVETCHGSAKSGGLDLRVGAAYASLVGAAATGAPGDLRVAPGDSAQLVFDSVARHLQRHAPWGAQVTVTLEQLGEPCSIDATGPAYDAARSAFAEAWGHEPVDIGIGGSIPFIATFQELFPKASILVTGVEDPHGNAHGPNESLHWGEFERACVAEALLLAKLAGLRP